MSYKPFAVLGVQRVVDGDTLDLNLDLGFKVFTTVRIRLARVNCPEKNTFEGKLAKEFTEQWVQKWTISNIIIHGHDKYGRWIAEVVAGENNLSDHLLATGHAITYS